MLFPNIVPILSSWSVYVCVCVCSEYAYFYTCVYSVWLGICTCVCIYVLSSTILERQADTMINKPINCQFFVYPEVNMPIPSALKPSFFPIISRKCGNCMLF